jgi:RNA polymerase sigma-70 factor, ECF subfamily
VLRAIAARGRKARELTAAIEYRRGVTDSVDSRARASCQAGEHDRAVAIAVQEYGEELFSFLVGRLKNDDDAADVFSQTCEDLLNSLPKFEWRCSLRTWCYRLARSAAVRYQRSPMNRRDRRVAISHISELADQVRSRTVAHLRSEVKDGIRALRDQLDEDEQQLLVLRVDRDLGWNEIADILSDDDLDDAARARASARLRQQFQKLKTRLRELAIAEGLIDPT